MRTFILFLVLFGGSLAAQELQLVKATRQTVFMGASAMSTTNYMILIEKKSKFKWSIDSITSILTGAKVEYHLVKVDDPTVLSPNYRKVAKFSKNDTGKYQINFGITKQRGGGRPGVPQNMKADTTNIEGGVYIHYHSCGRKKKLQVVDFELLDDVEAP